MDEIAAAIGDAIAGSFASPFVSALTLFVGAYVVVVWFASALWAFVDMRRRTGSPVAPYASAAIVILASPLLFPFAILVHRVVRPDEFISERRLSSLRDHALQAEASAPRCPECRLSVDETWLLCPTCRRSLGHRCHGCGGTVKLDWPVCAWCGEALDGETPRELRIRA